MKRLKIYVMHSTKFDYINTIYKDIISSDLYLHHDFILPLSDNYKNKYAKDLIKDADLVVVDLYKVSLGERIELKWLNKFDKKCIFLSLDNKPYINKYKDKLIIHDKDNTYINIISKFIDDNIGSFASKDNIYTLGDI